MELKDIVKLMGDRIKTLVILSILGLLVGLGVYLSPEKYKAEGTFYVDRNIQVSEDGSFSYEGYYSQQVSINFTETIIAYLESPDLRNLVLMREKTNVNEENLRKLKKSIRPTRAGPQVVQLTVLSDSYEQAKNRWKIISEIIQTDPLKSGLNIKAVSQDPVVTSTYKSLGVFSIAGLMLGTLMGVLIISINEYFKD